MGRKAGNTVNTGKAVNTVNIGKAVNIVNVVNVAKQKDANAVI